MRCRNGRARGWIGFAILAITRLALAGDLRIATYNIEADINGVTTPRAGMSTVLKGIADENVNGVQRPLDILALQETTSNLTTVDAIVSQLNTLYGSGVYARSAYQATQSGSNASGNGPNAIVYNTQTLQLFSSVGVGTPLGSSNGEYRQVVRYQFQAVGTSSTFYIYVSHAKAGTNSSDFSSRNSEAQIIRADEASLPATSRVIYVGDFNTTGSTDASYQTLATSGQGQAFDPINSPGSWDINSAFQAILTESATDLRYRDDLQLVKQNVLNDLSGLAYVPGTYHTFADNGATPVFGSVNSAGNTALSGLGPTEQSAVLSALTSASDHLPVVADYSIPVPEPALASLAWVLGMALVRIRRPVVL
jgi:endonuclease/exonuclease/phosphatase family metal-dependent hydrolase